MATKEVTIIHPDEFKAITATPAALAAYDFASRSAGVELEPGSGEEADFIAARNNKGEGWRDLDALRRFFEAAAKSIQGVVEQAILHLRVAGRRGAVPGGAGLDSEEPRDRGTARPAPHGGEHLEGGRHDWREAHGDVPAVHLREGE